MNLEVMGLGGMYDLDHTHRLFIAKPVSSNIFQVKPYNLFLGRYAYDWKREEANKNLLRTHTTAVSSRMLYQLAQVCICV